MTRPRFLPRPGRRSADHYVRIALQRAGRLAAQLVLGVLAVLALAAIDQVDQVFR